MKLRYILGGIAVALILVACSKPKQEPAPTTDADKATTEQVAKEAEAAAKTEPTSDSAQPQADKSKTDGAQTDKSTDNAQADKAKEADKKEADKPADKKGDEPKASDTTKGAQPEGDLKAEDRVSEDQKY